MCHGKFKHLEHKKLEYFYMSQPKYWSNESVVNFFFSSANEKYLPDDEVVHHEFKYKKRDTNFSQQQ